ncbi:MAG: primosomal protein N' [Cellvibrionaceae bacterium]
MPDIFDQEDAVILDIAVPSPLRRSFDYLPPLEMTIEQAANLQSGTRLKVNFANQQLVGILLKVKSTSELSLNKLKPALSVVDDQPCINSEILSLCLWGSDYYQHPIGEVLSTAIPTLLRQGEPAKLPAQKMWALTTNGKGLPKDSLKRAPKQSALLNHFLDKEKLSIEELKRSPEIAPFSAPTLKELQKKGLIEEIEEEHSADPKIRPASTSINATTKQTPLTLNEEQSSALTQLRYKEFNTFLLEGATGSGKTEVYLQAITKVLEQNQSVLILVPEIGLTPQLLNRFAARFSTPIATLHSGLNDKERLHAWLNASLGNARIVIGTRSAIFTPIPNLGLIIIDEEHDLSFKQQDGFRYSARDIAVVRAHKLKIPLILGTATPSLETLYNAIQNRYQHLRLTQRAGNAKPPQIEMVDLREQKPTEGFSQTLVHNIQTELDKGNQALIFINRRGFAPVLMCEDCGWIAGCNHCSAKMTVHHHPPHMHCHHCGQQRAITRKCPDCFSTEIAQLGQGTERSEAFLQEHFPSVPVHRVDRDTTRRKNALSDLSDEVLKGEPCILVGTQMLAKGHHFPDVTLVGIIDIDSGLFSADFRGPERMGQLLVQVAGRAGREEKPGKVVIQSYHCDHPSLQSLIHEGYHRYARRLLHERQLTGLPPYRYMALVRSESKRPENATEFLTIARKKTQQQFPSTQNLSYLGPLPGLMERKKDRFCFQLQISSDNRQLLHQVIRYLCREMDANAASRRTRWSIDIDPVDMT